MAGRLHKRPRIVRHRKDEHEEEDEGADCQTYQKRWKKTKIE